MGENSITTSANIFFNSSLHMHQVSLEIHGFIFHFTTPPPTSFKLVNKHIPIILNPQSHPITLFCNNSEAVAQSKDPRNHKKGKHIERKYHIIRDIVARGDVVVTNIDSVNNLADPFTKTLPKGLFSHIWRE